MLLGSLFISDVFAAETVQNMATAPASQSNFVSFIPLILIFIIFYFLLIRPQQNKIKEHQELVNNLKVNDKVCTSAGIFGKVKSIDQKDNIIELEIAKDVVIKVARNSIGEVIKIKK